MLLSWSSRFWEQKKGQRRPGCRRQAYGCLLLLILLVLLLCSGLFMLAHSAAAQTMPAVLQPAGHQSLAVYLLIDNSNSMFEMSGIGSDPELLRLDAARLFISYLGVDAQIVHRCGVIFFGDEANLVVPLTPLTDAARRADIFSLLANPSRMGWTDHVAALTLAYEQLQVENPGGRSAIILLTDGKPEWSHTPSPVEQAQYTTRLQAVGERLAQAGIPLFLILLANEATDTDADITEVWQPMWQTLSAAVTPGRFYTARRAEELAGIYHDMVVALTGKTTGPVAQAAASPAGHEKLITIAPGLLRLTLVVSKSTPDISVAIFTPSGERVTTTTPGVTHAGQPGVSREEVWAIETPIPGQWLVRLTGEGQVTVWQDYEMLPDTPTPTMALPVTPVATPTNDRRWLPTSLPATVLQPPNDDRRSTTTTGHPLTLAAETPAITTTEQPVKSNDARISPPSSRRRLWWLPFILLFVTSGVYGVWRWRTDNQPIVTGTLHLLSSPGLLSEPTSIDLESYQRPRLTIGQAPADISLAGAGGQITIRPGEAVGDTYGMLVTGNGPIWLAGESLTTMRPLPDAADIVIGALSGPAYRLRYDNLRLRVATQGERDWRLQRNEK